MRIVDRIRRWWQRRQWDSDRMAEKRAQARRHAMKSLLCERCSAPLFHDEIAFRRCGYCQRIDGPRPLGKAATR